MASDLVFGTVRYTKEIQRHLINTQSDSSTRSVAGQGAGGKLSLRVWRAAPSCSSAAACVSREHEPQTTLNNRMFTTDGRDEMR